MSVTIDVRQVRVKLDGLPIPHHHAEMWLLSQLLLRSILDRLSFYTKDKNGAEQAVSLEQIDFEGLQQLTFHPQQAQLAVGQLAGVLGYRGRAKVTQD